MADKEKELIHHFMFPLKTPKTDEAAPGMVEIVPVDDDGEPIEEDARYGRLDALTVGQWVKVAHYHEERGKYHLGLSQFAIDRVMEMTGGRGADEDGNEPEDLSGQ